MVNNITPNNDENVLEKGRRVIIELKIPRDIEPVKYLENKLKQFETIGCNILSNYTPSVLEQREGDIIVSVPAVVLPGTVNQLKSLPDVENVWSDPEIHPFADCDTDKAKGLLEDVVTAIGADKIWKAGFRGEGIVVGVCDDGVDKTQFPVIDGWSPYTDIDWGEPGDHGHMVSTAVTGVAPKVEIADIGILRTLGGVSSTISEAVAGFDWAIRNYRERGWPQILTNSWGIYDKSTAEDYATNSSHPFTRKVAEAIRSGIIVLFAAGNCGSSCPSDRCGDNDTGPGNSIWGANGHRYVITVGAVNINDEWVGYSSEGPAALSEQKPDLCGLTHYKGYYDIDTGTSAATPICAGVVALLSSAFPFLDTNLAQLILTKSSRDLGPKGWDSRFGHGVVNCYEALKLGTAIFQNNQ